MIPQGNETRAAIAGAVRAAHSILLVNHVEPDGDCLGSTLALGLALETLGTRVIVGSDGGVPPSFAFLPGAGRIVTDPPAEGCEVAVAMECSTLDRCGRFAAAVGGAPLIVTIDHHQTAEPFGQLNDWDPSAAAVGEMVTDLIARLGVPLTPDIATDLLAAVATDTGVFRFATVKPDTLRLAAELLEHGGRLTQIVTEVYENRPPEVARLLGLVLDRLVVTRGGRVAYSAVTDEMRRAAGTEDASGIVGTLRGIRGVTVALLFEERRDGVKVGIRARGGVRASVIAEAFGGGGHAGAAGCTLAGPLDQAIAHTLEAVDAELAVHA